MKTHNNPFCLPPPPSSPKKRLCPSSPFLLDFAGFFSVSAAASVGIATCVQRGKRSVIQNLQSIHAKEKTRGRVSGTQGFAPWLFSAVQAKRAHGISGLSLHTLLVLFGRFLLRLRDGPCVYDFRGLLGATKGQKACSVAGTSSTYSPSAFRVGTAAENRQAGAQHPTNPALL